ncbi:L,D-transpeptidase family protein [Sphingobium boeckii]|uniref:Lipoprotein-anchoring transpeptidase ErfK/SrfK n=1 Tax=Sphingobium boeckii TaxID=1082345 RepID=A0A7W9EF46_9SPHN|nr:L,D-transpeptidase family protein [Sphingobium boeckii]MBB5686928.1 lipoprotein-anchoring transpeptidase ErfK/SrfK [Sphingobium boeckii]
MNISLIARTGAKLVFAAALGAGAMAMTGLPVRLPAREEVPRPAAKPAVLQSAMQTIDAAAADPAPYVIKDVLQIDHPLRHGDYVWNDEGVPAGPLLITVDLEAQTLSVFRAGYEIGVAVIVYGADEKPTPLGAFAISEKDADHVSNLYDAPMPYMLRLTDDGVAIHGSEVAADAATHGCVGVPTAFAKRLFGQAKLGDRVVITRDRMLRIGNSVPVA